MEQSALTVNEFLARNRISRSTWFKLRRAGRAPRVMELGAAMRISLAAEAEWQRRMEAETESAAGRLAAERRGARRRLHRPATSPRRRRGDDRSRPGDWGEGRDQCAR